MWLNRVDLSTVRIQKVKIEKPITYQINLNLRAISDYGRNAIVRLTLVINKYSRVVICEWNRQRRRSLREHSAPRPRCCPGDEPRDLFNKHYSINFNYFLLILNREGFSVGSAIVLATYCSSTCSYPTMRGRCNMSCFSIHVYDISSLHSHSSLACPLFHSPPKSL